MDEAVLPEGIDPEKTYWQPNTAAASGNIETPELLQPPKYTVDLSLPPEQRYLHIVPDFIDLIQPLPEILEELTVLVPWIPGSWLKFLAKTLLRKVYDEEEDRELRGIAKAVGLDLYLLVAMNSFLDLLMGCTSGGVRVRNPRNHRDTKMLHFRTLDWDMDPLRKLVIVIDFVNGPGGDVLYTSITYFGYVGVLTGLKEGLSLALNFRPIHDTSSLKKRFAFRWHQILVILGRRRNISSELRRVMTRPTRAPQIIAKELQQMHSTAAYITLCDGQTTVVLDNDNCGGLIRQDPNFILAVNHDVADGQKSSKEYVEMHHEAPITGVQFILFMSTNRQECMEGLWKDNRNESRNGPSITKDQLIEWMETSSELSNDETHFGVVMDPTDGKIAWLQRYQEPLHWQGDSDEEEEVEDTDANASEEK